MADTSTEYLLRLVEPPISLALKGLPFRRTLPCHLLFGPLKRQVERDGEYYEGPKPQ